jgi:hypothetical protein
MHEMITQSEKIYIIECDVHKAIWKGALIANDKPLLFNGFIE